jgi:hypothetical protein
MAQSMMPERNLLYTGDKGSGWPGSWRCCEMTCTETENNELLNSHIVAESRGSQLRVRLADGREIRAIPLLEALEKAECPEALIYNRPVQVRMYKHPKLPRIVWIGRPE